MTIKNNPGDVSPDKDIYKWKALLTVALGTMMATMDASITNIAFPILTRVFRAELTTVVWVTVAFILVSTSTMLIIGKIGDLIGRKRIYVAGMAVFTLGMLACAAAQSIGQLVFFRCLQAVGAAMTISTSMAIVTEAFPRNEVGKGIGFLGMSVSVGFIIGPILGGFLLDWLNWRSIFYVRAPAGLLAFLLALTLLRRDDVQDRVTRLDLLGTLTSSAGIFSFVFGLGQIRVHGPLSSRVLLMTGLGLVFIILFVWVERRATDPIVDLKLFKNRVFSRSMWAMFLLFVAAPPFMLIMPFYLIQGREMSPSQAGMLMAVTSVITMVVGPLSGSFSDRFDPAKIAAFGAGMIGAAYCLMLTFGIHTPLTVLISTMALLGLGIGSFHPPNNNIIMSSVPGNRLGTASALIATQRQVGMSVGMAVTSTLFSARQVIHQTAFQQEGLSEVSAAVQSIPHAFHDVLILGLIIQCIVFMLCFVRKA